MNKSNKTQTFFSSNIKFLRKRKGKTQDEVASYLEIPRSTLNNYENKISQPNIDILLGISEYFGISVDSLLRSDLRALSEYQLSQLERGIDVYLKGSRIRILATTVDRENNENIDLVHEKAKAGYMSGFADPEFIKSLPKFSLPFLDKQKKYRTFPISGDSMYPIPDGAWVTGVYVQDWTKIKTGEACIILTINDGIVFKIVENKIKEQMIFVLHSLNPAYDSYSVNVEEIKEVWKFVHFISSEIPEPDFKQTDLPNVMKDIKNDLNMIKQSLGIK